jgi:hypothetical protein
MIAILSEYVDRERAKDVRESMVPRSKAARRE